MSMSSGDSNLFMYKPAVFVKFKISYPMYQTKSCQQQPFVKLSRQLSKPASWNSS